jgi:hypothetical protein
MLSKLGRGFQSSRVETVGVFVVSDNIFALMVETSLDFGGLGLEKSLLEFLIFFK